MTPEALWKSLEARLQLSPDVDGVAGKPGFVCGYSSSRSRPTRPKRPVEALVKPNSLKKDRSGRPGKISDKVGWFRGHEGLAYIGLAYIGFGTT